MESELIDSSRTEGSRSQELTNDRTRSLTKTIDAEVDGEMAVLKEAINDMVYKLRLFSSEVTRVSLDVGTRGQLGGQAVVTGVEGTWRTRALPFIFL